MAPGVAKPFSREWMVECVDNRRNHIIPMTSFGRTKLDGKFTQMGKLFGLWDEAIASSKPG